MAHSGALVIIKFSTFFFSRFCRQTSAYYNQGMPLTSSLQNMSRSKQLLHRLQNCYIPATNLPCLSSHFKFTPQLHAESIKFTPSPKFRPARKATRNKFIQSCTTQYRIYQRKNQVAGIGMGRGICWFYVQKKVKQEDWEHLSTVYNGKAEYYLFSSRTTAQFENKTNNLKDQCKKLKDSLHKTGEGFDNDKINDFPFFETFELLLGGKESYNLKHVLDPTLKTRKVKNRSETLETC